MTIVSVDVPGVPPERETDGGVSVHVTPGMMNPNLPQLSATVLVRFVAGVTVIVVVPV